jgi:hypothetical protein
MLSGEDQRRFDQIAHHLQAADPKFVARLDGMAPRRARLLTVLCVLLWAAVPALTVVGGWAAAGAAAGRLHRGIAAAGQGVGARPCHNPP